MVPQSVTFLSLGCSWASYPPTLPDLLEVEQTPSVGRGLAALRADESATWAWLPPRTVPSVCTLGKKTPSFPNTSLSCYTCSFDCPFWPTIGTSSAPPPLTALILSPQGAEVSGLFLKPRAQFTASSSFSCSCETPQFCRQMPWQLECRASRYRLRP